MEKWNYTFNGSHLRELVHGADSEQNQVEILNTLQNAYNDIIANCKTLDEYDIERLEESRDLIDGDDEIVKDFFKNPRTIHDFGFESSTELVDSRLEEFYYNLDYFRIWISL